MTDDPLELAKGVLAWWEEHRLDFTVSCSTEEDCCEEYFLYEEEPEFVKLAKKILAR